MPKNELVNHPGYYNREIECIEEMRLVFGDEETAIFCKLNAWKYRYGRIGKPAVDVNTDLQKSDWYMGYFQDLKTNAADPEQIQKERDFKELRLDRSMREFDREATKPEKKN